MDQGLHNEGESSILEVYLRGGTRPSTNDFTLRVSNSLLLRVTGTSASSWDTSGEETVEGSSSGDTGTLKGAQDNGDGSVTLKLGNLGQVEVFAMGETITGQTSGASGTVDNAVFNISNISSNNFQLNEQVVDGTSGATADLKGVYGNVMQINNINGSFGQGNTITGQESGATATLDNQYAGVPGLFDDDTYSDIVDEGTNYTPPTLSANTTDWSTKTTDLAGNYYAETKEISIGASGGDLGPFNLGVLTVDTGSGETLLSTAPISGTPPSEVIPSGGTITLQFALKLE